jgi:trigger factor
MALVEGCKHSLDITVPVVEVEKETERVVAEIQKKVKLPGFRPGKAPVGLVKQRFAGDIRQDVLEKLVPRFFRAAADQDHLQVVGQPNVTDVHFHAGEPITFKAEFEVAPTFELGEYRGITITYNEPQVTDAEVDARIEEIREQKAEYVNEEPRPLADGDYAVVSLESLSGVAEKVSQDELMLKMGDEATMKEFTENLRGAAPEESREFDVAYPEDYDRKQLAGHTVRFKATVKAVRRKELPEVNDEFAKDLGDYQTVFELKEAVRKSILHDREHKAQDDSKHQLIEKLVDTHDFPIPDVYIDRQVEINVENQLRALAAQGVDPRGIKLDWAKVRETQKDKAARDVKASLLLDKIGEREAIGATQEEVDREVQKIARQQREAVAMTRAKLQKDGAIARIAGNIRTEKTLNFLFENARKEAGKPEAEPEKAE